MLSGYSGLFFNLYIFTTFYTRKVNFCLLAIACLFSRVSKLSQDISQFSSMLQSFPLLGSSPSLCAPEKAQRLKLYICKDISIYFYIHFAIKNKRRMTWMEQDVFKDSIMTACLLVWSLKSQVFDVLPSEL